jgi:hypothetical protein
MKYADTPGEIASVAGLELAGQYPGVRHIQGHAVKGTKVVPARDYKTTRIATIIAEGPTNSLAHLNALTAASQIRVEYARQPAEQTVSMGGEG